MKAHPELMHRNSFYPRKISSLRRRRAQNAILINALMGAIWRAHLLVSSIKYIKATWQNQDTVNMYEVKEMCTRLCWKDTSGRLQLRWEKYQKKSWSGKHITIESVTICSNLSKFGHSHHFTVVFLLLAHHCSLMHVWNLDSILVLPQ